MNETSHHPYPAIARLLEAAHAVEAQAEQTLGRVGLSLAKVGVLRHLDASPEPLPLTLLSSQCRCVKSNITQLVDRLEADGLVRRIPDQDDRRCIRAALTARGRAKCREAVALLTALDAILASKGAAGEVA